MMKDFKIIEAAGTPYEIGFAHGRTRAEEVLCSIATYKEMFKTYANLGWEEAKHRSRAYIEHISRYDSDLLEEIRGVAVGASVELEDILALNARSEVILMSGSKSLRMVAPLLLLLRKAHRTDIRSWHRIGTGRGGRSKRFWC